MSSKTYSKRKVSILHKLLIAVFCLALFLSIASLCKQLSEKKAELSVLEEQKVQKEANIKEFNQLTTNGTKEEIIEKAARERLGYVFADEQVYKDISGN